MNLKSLVKIGITVAAVILIGFALLLNTPTAKAITIEQIYKAIEKVKNVYISSFVPDKTEPTQEMWVSRTLNIYMLKTGKELVFWDLTNKVRKIKQWGADLVETIQLSDDLIATIEKRISGSLGLLPFAEISKVPKDSKWSRVADGSLGIIDESTEVYDLTWIEKKYGDSVVFEKWRFFIDTKTKLPQTIEFYQKSTADSEYNLKYARVVGCLSDSEIWAVIKDAGF